MTMGNTLVYFPSYAEAERYHERVSIEGECLLDRPGTRAENLRQRCVDHDDAALFTSLWGTLTEGHVGSRGPRRSDRTRPLFGPR